VCPPSKESPDYRDRLYEWHNRRAFPRDAQKACPARPQRATKDDPSKLARIRCKDGSDELPTARVPRAGGRLGCPPSAGGIFQHPAMSGRTACGRPAAAASTIGWTVAETGEADGDGGAFARRAADAN
jgi:hypothetical protein